MITSVNLALIFYRLVILWKLTIIINYCFEQKFTFAFYCIIIIIIIQTALFYSPQWLLTVSALVLKENKTSA